MMTSDESKLGEIWNDYYAQVLDEAPWGSSKPDQHVVTFFQHHAFPPGTRCLDVGCGHGKNSQFIRSEGHEVTGVDFSAAAIEDARRRFPGVRFEVERAEALSFADQSFDVVVDAGCLHTNPPDIRQKILKEYARVCRPGGHLFARLFRRYPIGYYEEPFGRTGPLPIWGFQEEEARHVFDGIDFSIEHFELDESYGQYGCFYIYGRRS